MPTRIEIWWKDQLVGHVLSPCEACEAVRISQEEDVTTFAGSSGDFFAEPGVEVGTEWYRGLRVDGRWVDGAELLIGDVEPL